MKGHDRAIGREQEIASQKRILCIGRIHKGRRTVVIAFHRKEKTNMSQFHRAERKKGKLRLAIAGPTGSAGAATLQ
jgi:hypothetical protein